jgi:polyhydroxyalkanoate synthase
MTIADDNQKPKPAKKLAKSLDAIAALRIAMEQRLQEEQAREDAQSKAAQPEPQAEPTPPPEAQKPEPKKSAEKESGKKFDPAEWPRIMFDIAERSQKLIKDYLERNKDKPVAMTAVDPARLTEAFSHLLQRILNDPERFVNAQLALWQGYAKIWQTALERMQGKAVAPVITPAPSDKRFKDSEWQSNWVFDYIKQSYLLTAEWTRGFTHQETADLDPKQARKVEFYMRQMIDAMSPSNFWLTNPEVLRTTFESNGENLIKGLENLLGDLERGGGQLQISMADMSTLKVGENIATTPGKVVYQNNIIQLIQYAPQTESVFSTPLLLVPPWINKYYILDLQKKNSFIGYLVAQGYTVFCVSWVNPDQRHADVNFEDYMTDGMMAAMRETRRATGCEDINILGYCIGGTLLATTLAYLNAAPNPPQDLPKVKSATYLVTMIDFSEPGDLGVFIDEDQVEAIEAKMASKGYLEASSMATTFNLLRSNDLIWSFVVNNYLLGKDPFPFDILYWNCDSTNLPAAMQSFYLRNMYIDNKLVVPKQMVMKDVPIDVRSITTPSFLLSTRDDHIAPWRSTYAATQMYNAPIRFVLSGSGHIAGIINPPSAKKYGYWTNDALPPKPDEWLKDAQPHEGSWWPEWLKWLQDFAGDKVPAREIRNGIEDAPGSYVRVRAI